MPNSSANTPASLTGSLIRFDVGPGLEWLRLLGLGPGRTGPRWFDDSSGLVGGT